MTERRRQFNDFMTQEMLRILGLSISEYATLLFEAGIKALENNSKYKSYFVSTGAYWDCFSYRACFINLNLVAEEKFRMTELGEDATKMDAITYFKLITEKFELPKRVINLINKQYRIDFENAEILKNGNLKPLQESKRTRTPRKVKNQTQINLNTI